MQELSGCVSPILSSLIFFGAFWSDYHFYMHFKSQFLVGLSQEIMYFFVMCRKCADCFRNIGVFEILQSFQAELDLTLNVL